MTGRTVSGREDADMSLVALAVPGDQLEETVKGIAAGVAEPDPVAMRYQKANLNAVRQVWWAPPKS